jgi:hypothetical protein
VVSLPPALAFVLVVLRPLARTAYWVLIRTAARYLRRGLSGASVYVAGTGALGELVVGLSDVDLVVVLGGPCEAVGHDRAVVLARWRRFRRFLPLLARGIGIALYSERDLADEEGGTALTYGLASSEARRDDAPGGYLRPGRPVDELYRRIHPGIYGPGRTWRRVSGAPRTPVEPVGSASYRRLAAWLELQWWWRFSFELCTSPHRAFASYMAFKLVAEPIKIWLWLRHGERVEGRRAAIERALALMPDEEEVLRGALALHDRLPRAGEPPRMETLAWLLRIGSRIAALIETEVAAYGTTTVRLRYGDLELGREAGAAAHMLTPASETPRCIPLADWRARAMPPLADEALVVADVDAADPVALGSLAASAIPGLQPVVRTGGLLVLPNNAFSDRVLLRSVQCPASDPVSFAVLGDRELAAFPDVAGWSALDCARRAVREHRAWLAGWTAGEPPPALALDLLFTAARAALFREGVRGGEPELSLSASATATGLVDRHPQLRAVVEEAHGAFREARTTAAVPQPPLLESFRRAVERLPAYLAPS